MSGITGIQNGITWMHIGGGVLALATGVVALTVRKGSRMHVSAGSWFCAAMFVLGVTASILEPLKSPPESPIGGIMVCYFVATAWMAARRRSGVPGRFEKIACAIVLAIAAAIIGHGFELAQAPPGQFSGPPGPGGLFKLSATQRLTRHLWRMCFAFFIATGSFFLGQQDVLPQAVRGSPILWVLAFAPFALMLFWLVRVRLSRIGQMQQHAPLPAEE
jgi:uncharacterized membrane protein